MPTVMDKKINVENLREEIRKPVRILTERLLNDFGDNIKSIALIGSALTEDFHPTRSDINSFVLIEHENREQLKTLAGYGQQFGKMRIHAPVIMTQEFLAKSIDVFGIEFLDFQLNHKVVYGLDVFSDMKFDKSHVRLQCERELRTVQIQLWQGYIRGLGLEKNVEPLLMDCAGKLLTLFRAMLWLMDIDRAKETKTTLEMTGVAFGFDEKIIAALLNLRRKETHRGADIVDLMFWDVYQIVVHLAKLTDKLGTNR